MKSEYLKPETYEALEKVMQRENVLALRVSVETGLRIDDVLRMKWEDFRKSGKFVYIAKKTGKKGTKTISKGLKNELFARKTGKSEYVFPGRKRGKHRTRQAVWKDMVQAADRIGVLQNATPHSARKTYAVELRKEEGLAAVQRELQHQSQTTTMIYAFADLVRQGSGKQTADPNDFDLEGLADLITDRLLKRLFEEWKNLCPFYHSEEKKKDYH